MCDIHLGFFIGSSFVLTRELHWAGWCLSGVSFCIFLNRPLSSRNTFFTFFLCLKRTDLKIKILDNKISALFVLSSAPSDPILKYIILSHFEAKHGTKWWLEFRENHENEETTGWKKKSQSWTWSNIGRESDGNRRNWCKYYPICTFIIFLNPPFSSTSFFSFLQIYMVFSVGYYLQNRVDFGVKNMIISNCGALTFLLIYSSPNSNPLF